MLFLKKILYFYGEKMKIVRVAAAVIRSRNESGEPVIFATQRGYGEV